MLGLVVGFMCLMFGGFMILGGAVRRASCADWEHSAAKDSVDTGLVLVMISLLIIAGSFIWCLIGLSLSGKI